MNILQQKSFLQLYITFCKLNMEQHQAEYYWLCHWMTSNTYASMRRDWQNVSSNEREREREREKEESRITVPVKLCKAISRKPTISCWSSIHQWKVLLLFFSMVYNNILYNFDVIILLKIIEVVYFSLFFIHFSIWLNLTLGRVVCKK